MNSPLHGLGVRAAAAAIRDGKTTAEALTAACLERIAAVDPAIEAWAFLDPGHALAQARAADRLQAAGAPLGPLHGVPVALKDIYDTADMPTECGTALHAGRQPTRDAWTVARLRAAGAVLLGKAVTTELAVFHPGKTRNPHDGAHTPGGSSSGSAAAVAAGMVPLALGTQTNGSMIRPAAFCGVVGYKPTFGRLPRSGVMLESLTLDQLGLFGRSVADVALAAETLFGDDAGDLSTQPRATPPLLATALSDPARPPRLAFVRSPVWAQAEPATRQAFLDLVARLGPEVIREVDLDPVCDNAVAWHRAVMHADLALNFAREYGSDGSGLSAVLRGMIEEGQQVRAVDFNAGVASRETLNAALAPLFADYDAILTPATVGAAPRGLDATGSPIFCTLWTLSGTPSLSLPLLTAENGLPLGVQLVGPRDGDARLLRTARWLAATLGLDDDGVAPVP